jgi:hypothetical protein
MLAALIALIRNMPLKRKILFHFLPRSFSASVPSRHKVVLNGNFIYRLRRMHCRMLPVSLPVCQKRRTRCHMLQPELSLFSFSIQIN